MIKIERIDYEPLNKARIGDFSVYNFADKTTYVYPEHAYEYEGVVNTVPFHVAQIHNGIHFTKGERFWKVPLRSVPMRLPYAYYVDIKSAYRQIGSIWGAETYWKEGKPKAYGEYKYTDAIFDVKLARGLILSMTHEYRHECIWQDKKVTTIKKKNWKNAPNLHNAIFGTLHQIFYECGNVPYINTDGMIVPSFMIKRVIKTLDKWGLKYGIKDEGTCQIYGVGCYGFNGKLPYKINRNKVNKIDDEYRPEIFTYFMGGNKG